MPGDGLLLAVVKVLWPKGLNSTYYLDINDFSRHTAWAHKFMHHYALWLGLVLLVVLFLLAYAIAWWRRDARAAVLLVLGGAGTLIALGLNQLVSHAAKELRPYVTFPHALVLVGKANDYAFPSDHAVVAGALVMSVLLVVRRAKTSGGPVGAAASPSVPTAEGGRGFTPVMVVLAAVTVVLALFLCFARIYVGAHYPGDVVGGLLLGIAVVGLVSAARPLGYWCAERIDETALAALLRRPFAAATLDPGRAQSADQRGAL